MEDAATINNVSSLLFCSLNSLCLPAMVLVEGGYGCQRGKISAGVSVIDIVVQTSLYLPRIALLELIIPGKIRTTVLLFALREVGIVWAVGPLGTAFCCGL